MSGFSAARRRVEGSSGNIQLEHSGKCRSSTQGCKNGPHHLLLSSASLLLLLSVSPVKNCRRGRVNGRKGQRDGGGRGLKDGL